MWGSKKDKEAKKDEKSYVKACPRCGSRKVVMEAGVSIYIILGWVYQYRCKECNYFGPNVLIVEENTEKLVLMEEERS